MSKLQSVWDLICRHKYLVVIVTAIAVVGFLDENSVWNRHFRKAEIRALRSEIDKYKTMYDEDTRRLDELEHNPFAVEKLARERYLMKRDDEDVFVVVDPVPQPQTPAEDEERDTLLNSIPDEKAQ